MSRIIGNDKHRALAWALDRWGEEATASGWNRFAALYLEKDGDIQAAVLYKDFIPANSIEVHLAAVAGGRWLTRSFLRAAFQYPFDQLGVRRITALMPSTNYRGVKWTEHCGFQLEGIAREAGTHGEDVFIYGMLKRECRFLGENLGQKRYSDASRSRADCSGANGIEPLDGNNQCRVESRKHQHAIW